uniref:Uncharacterized protein n=1 Tax=Rhizochromulina marina TaxID=1034831 RepID=A0A7S2SRJ5_9STRA
MAVEWDQRPPFAPIHEEKEEPVEHVLTAHTHAADAEQATLEGDTVAARDSHLEASRCFLAGSEACSDLVVRRCLITLSRAHSQAAYQASVRAARGAAAVPPAGPLSPPGAQGERRSMGARSPSWSRATPMQARSAIAGAIPEDQESSGGDAQVLGQSRGVADLGQGFQLECSVLAPRKRTDRPGAAQSTRPRPSQDVDEFFALRKALERIGTRALERPGGAPDKARGMVGSVLGESFFDLGDHKQHPAIDLSASIQNIKRSVHRPVGMPRRKLPSTEALLQGSTRSATEAAPGDPAAMGGGAESMGTASPPLVGAGETGQIEQEVVTLRAQLVRCVETTNQLHDENFQLLQEREAWEAIRRQNGAVQQSMLEFKAEYSEKFEQVREKLVAFRKEFPHLANPAVDVSSSEEWTRLLQLKRGYEKKSKKLQEAQSTVRHLEEKLKKAETTVQRYQRVFMKIKADQQAARKSRRIAQAQSSDGGGSGGDGALSGASGRGGAAPRGEAAAGLGLPPNVSGRSPRYARPPSANTLPTMPEEGSATNSSTGSGGVASGGGGSRGGSGGGGGSSVLGGC